MQMRLAAAEYCSLLLVLGDVLARLWFIRTYDVEEADTVASKLLGTLRCGIEKEETI